MFLLYIFIISATYYFYFVKEAMFSVLLLI